MITKKLDGFIGAPLPPTRRSATKVDSGNTSDPLTISPPNFFARYPLEILESTPNYGHQHKTTDQTIKVKYKDLKGEKTFEESYEYKDIITPNKERFETAEQESIRRIKVEIAQQLSDKIRLLLFNGELKRYITNTERVTINDFIKCMRVAAIREGDFAATSADDDEIIALTAYFTLKEKFINGNLLLGFNRFPDGLLTPGDARFLPRVNVLAKHYLIDLIGIKKPDDLKKLGSYDKVLNDGHLRTVLRTFSPPSLFNFLFPGFQDGSDPIIPAWKTFGYPNKWEGEDGKVLAQKASKWVLTKEGAINSNGTINLKILKEKNWSNIFYSNEYGLGGMLTSCPFTKNIFEAIKLATPEAIGFEENQIKPWEITYMNMWQAKDSEGKMLIDHVTEYIVKKYLPDKYQINLLKENGRLDSEKVKEINWGRLYHEVCPSALINSPVKAHEALQRLYSDSFGLQNDQIKSWELRWEGKWEGDKGKQLFNKAFLYNLAKDGLGDLDLTGEPKIIFTKEKLESKLSKERPNLQKIIGENGLMSGFRKAYNGNLNTAIANVFNAPAELEKPRDAIKYLQSIIEHNKGRIEILLETDKAVARESQEITDKTKDKDEDGFCEAELTKDLKVYADNSFLEKETIWGYRMDPLLVTYLDDIGKIPLLTAEEERALAYKVKEGDKSAKDELTVRNLRLVASIAKKYANKGLSFSDLIQEGNLGLMKAVEKNDPDRGFRFSTYAAWWIKSYIRKALNNTSRTIRVPTHMLDQIKDLIETTKKLSQESNQTNISNTEIASHLNITEEKVKSLQSACKQPISINGTVSNDDERSFESLQASDDEDHTEQFALKSDLQLVLKTLTQSEREIIILRFGLDGNGTKTLDEIGKLLKVSRERVRQKEAAAMKKLQSPERIKILEAYITPTLA